MQGRNSYRRISNLVYYIFYKNIMMVGALYWYMFFNSYSGQKWVLEFGYQLYNVMYTSFPILFISVFDRDVSDETSRKLPQLYHLGIRAHYFNWQVALKWLAEATFESLAVALLCIYSLPKYDLEGDDPSLFFLGAHALTYTIILANLKLLLWQWQVTYASTSLIFMGIFLWLVPTCFIASMSTIEPTNTLYTYIYGWHGLWVQVRGPLPSSLRSLAAATSPLTSQRAFSLIATAGRRPTASITPSTPRRLFDACCFRAQVLGTPSFYLLMVVVISIALMPQLFLVVWRRTFYPEFRDLVMEAETFGLDMDALAKYEILPLKRALVKKAPVSSTSLNICCP